MRRQYWNIVTLWFAVGLTGCGVAHGKDAPSDKQKEKEGSYVTRSGPGARGVTTSTRLRPIACKTRLGLTPVSRAQTSCTVPGAPATLWRAVPRARTRFSALPLSEVRRATPASPGFCVYQWTGRDFPAQADFARIQADPDCAVTAGMQATPPPTVPPYLPPLARAFERQARGMSAEPIQSAKMPHDVNPKNLPFIDVIDATPFDPTQMDLSGHGFAVSNVIANVACDGVLSPDCLSKIRHHLALPMLSDGKGDLFPNPKGDGGYFGTFQNLFDAVNEALDEYDSDKHQILNLSLGWDPIKTNADSIQVQEMTDLLKRAFCQGAIVVAAAGNETGSDGPMVPAAIEAFSPPDDAWCAHRGYPIPSSHAKPVYKGPARPYRTLVTAVSGVDLHDERLANSRPWGHARLAAYAEDVTVPAKGSPTGYTPPLTGTSMSAAIVSGIAAAIWAAQPQLSAHEVMARIYQSGRALDGTTNNRRSRCEFCLAEPGERCDAYTVRRASYCTAMNEVHPHSHRCVDPTAPIPANLIVPHTVPSAQDAIGPCDVTACRTPVGPDSQQLPMGVMPTPGVATCPGCLLNLNTPSSGIGTVDGTATVVPSGMIKTVLRVIDPSWTAHEYEIPIPTQNVHYVRAVSSVPTSANTASILWFYDLGAGSVKDTTTLKVQ